MYDNNFEIWQFRAGFGNSSMKIPNGATVKAILELRTTFSENVIKKFFSVSNIQLKSRLDILIKSEASAQNLPRFMQNTDVNIKISRILHLTKLE